MIARLPANVPGRLFVDASCINCDTCRWMAPDTYGHAAGKSYVHTQPPSAAGGALKMAALAAMVACPTGSIRLSKGVRDPDVRSVRSCFPLPIDEKRLPNVFHAGAHSPASFGATPYLLLGGMTTALIDSPRFNSQTAYRRKGSNPGRLPLCSESLLFESRRK